MSLPLLPFVALGAVTAVGICVLALARPRLLLYIIIGLAPTQFLFVPVWDFFLSPADVLVCSAIVALVVRLATLRRGTWYAVYQHRFLLLMLAAYMLGFVVLGRYSRTFVRLPLAIALSVLASELLRTRAHLSRAASALVFAGALDAAYGLYFVARGTPLHPSRFSGMSDVNFAAMLIGTSAVTALALLARTSRSVRLMRPAALGALALATLSQMGVFALVTAWVTVLRGIVARRNKVRIIVVCLLAVAVGLALSPVRERLLHRDDREVQRDGVARNSADVRRMILDTAWNAVQSRPILGVGYFRFLEYSNTNSAIRVSTGGQGYPTHNTYLEVLVEGGLVAFAFFALHWVQYLKAWPRTVRVAARQRDPILAASVVGFPVVMVCAALANVMLVYSFWLVCGLTLSAVNLQRREAWRARHLELAPILR